MKKILYLVGLFLLSMLAGLGQTSIPTFQYVNVAPSGVCPGITPPIQIVYATGLAYSCQMGVWGPFAGTGASGATLPTDAIVYGLSPTTSRAAVAGADYISPAITNGMAQIGTAGTGTNYNSNVFALYGDYCTGSPCAPAQDYYTFQNVVGTGVNPSTTLNISHFGSSGASSGAFNFPVSLATGSTGVTQATSDNTTKLATDAFVLANSGASLPTTPLVLKGNNAGGAAAATPGTDYVIPSGTVANLSGTPTLPNGTAAATQTTGDNTTKLATDAFVLANGGSTSPGGSSSDIQFNNTTFGGDPTFTFNSTTKNVGVKVINGTSHAEMYSGGISAQVNACIADAIAGTNGNTSHTCDATALGGGQTVTAEIDLGDSSNDPVGLLLPCSGYWTGSMTGGTQDVIKQYGGTTLRSVCPAGATGGTVVINNTSGSSPKYLLEIVGNGSRPYIYDQGFNVTNISGGHATSTGVGLIINGQLADASTLDSVNVYDALDSIAAEVYGACCQTTWTHSSINANFGGTPLYILTDSTNFTEDFTFSYGTIVHPGAGDSTVFCNDTRNSTVSSFTLDHVYAETGNSSNPAALILINGCSRASISHIDFPQYGTTGFPGVYITGAYDTMAVVDDIWFSYGTGPWSTPTPAVVNVYTGQQFNSDASGYFAHYQTPTATVGMGDSVNLGDLPYAGASGVANHLSGNPAATDEVLVSHGTGATSTPTTKTCVAVATSGTTSTCTWSTPPVAGEFVAISVFNYNSSATLSVTDSASDTYTAVAGPHSPTYVPGTSQLFYFGPLTGTITTTTVTSSASVTSLEILGDTATGIATASPVDGAACNADTFSSTSSSCSAALTTTEPNDYLFCGAYNETFSDSFTAGAGFTAGANAGNPNSLGQYKTQSAVGAITPAITSSSASPMTMACAAFRPVLSTQAPTLSAAPALSSANMTSDLYLDASQFSGADPSVKINACGAALLAAGGGTCDARALGGTSLQAMSETIAWGSHALISANESMVLLLPNTAQWEWALTGGTACGIEQFSNTSIIGQNTGGMWAGMQLVGASSANMDSLYCTDPSPVSAFGSNIYASGFFATNPSGGTFANGLVDFRELADDANFYRITAINPSGDAMHINDVCCGDKWDSIQGLSATSTVATGTGHALEITGKYTNIVIQNSTFNGPGTGKYNVYIDPTSNSNGLTFLGLYAEKYSTGDYGTPMVYVGADAQDTNIFGGLLTNGCSSSCAQYAVQNASLQGLNIEGLGYGYFSTNGVNDTANSFTQPTDGFQINNYHTRYTTGSAGPVNLYQDMSVGKLSGNLLSGAPSFSATTGTASLNSGSTNTFGSIASTTSGTLAFNLTMTGGPQLHRLVCTYTDETTPTDIIHETGSTGQYQSFASGTTVTGDTIVYVCGGY